MEKDKKKSGAKKPSQNVNKVSDKLNGKVTSGLVVIVNGGAPKPHLPKQQKCPK